MHLIESYKNLANVIKKANLVKNLTKYILELGGDGGKNRTGINER